MSRIFIAASLITACFVLGISGCKKSDPEPAPPDESGYLIVNNAGIFAGNISLYKRQKDELIGLAFQLSAKTTPATISDAVVSGDKLFVARDESRGVEIVNASNFQVINSVSYGKSLSFNAYKHLAVSPERIFVSDRDNIPNSPNSSNISYLKAIRIGDVTKIDSIPVIQNAAIWAMAYANGKVFVSAGYNQQSIFVFDATTYAKVGEIPLTSLCSAILIDKNNNVLALGTHLTLINSSDLSVIKVKSIFGASVNLMANDYSTASSGFSLDRENNVLYHLGYAPQPASAPFVLRSYDISSDLATSLSTSFISGTTVAFDQKRKVILVGDVNRAPGATGGVLKFYSTTGVLTKTVALPNTPSKIFETP